MSSHQRIVEYLPPEQGPDGRFGVGNSGGPGRPPGPIGFTKMMRDAIAESFKQVGGVDYLVMLAYWKPDLYTQLIGRAMPIKVAGDEDGTPIHVVNRVTRRVIPRGEKPEVTDVPDDG